MVLTGANGPSQLYDDGAGDFQQEAIWGKQR
jgi:hypothetical protein